MSNKLTQTNSGWVIINIGHPISGKEFISHGSFAFTKTGCIKEFIKGSGETWEYWRKKYNFRCVRATMTIQTD